MTAGKLKLFRHRLVSEWAYQYSVWKTVVDWTIALYIVLPFSALFINAYIGWWSQIPAGLNYIPLNVFLLIVLLFAWSGTLRIFVEEADQIFLLQRTAWIKSLIKYSIAYFIGSALLVTLLFGLAAAPFLLRHYGFTVYSLLWLGFSAFILKASIGILKQLIEFRFPGWKRVPVKMVLLAASGFYLQITAVCLLNQQPFSYILIFLLLIVLILLICRRTSLKGTLLSDIAMGQAAKMKLTNILLGYAGTYTKKPVTFRARPWLFRNSSLIFRQRTPENGLVELCLKSTLRHTANVMFYLQVIVVYALFMSIFPPVWKWVLWGASIFILTSYVKLHWLESINSPYVALFPLRIETKRGAASRSLFIMALPGEIILALFVFMQTQEWLYALIILPAGFFLSRFTAKRLA